ncbi:hypothetical protein M422DRAFT_40606 [Sphaerobolus stellatus SS14]|nr:hypothetical protein M422DRAFT_40606 [Sphaerobolus stellatus SS14]
MRYLRRRTSRLIPYFHKDSRNLYNRDHRKFLRAKEPEDDAETTSSNTKHRRTRNRGTVSEDQGESPLQGGKRKQSPDPEYDLWLDELRELEKQRLYAQQRWKRKKKMIKNWLSIVPSERGVDAMEVVEDMYCILEDD